MNNVTTWAVLSDGKYIKILINSGTGKQLSVLDADKHEDMAEICYQVVTGKSKRLVNEPCKSEQYNLIQLQADFLTKQHAQHLFDRLVIAAPGNVIQSLKNALPDQVKQSIVGELAEDILPKSNDAIENMLAKLIIDGK